MNYPKVTYTEYLVMKALNPTEILYINLEYKGQVAEINGGSLMTDGFHILAPLQRQHINIEEWTKRVDNQLTK